jgi:hypothetical protein
VRFCWRLLTRRPYSTLSYCPLLAHGQVEQVSAFDTLYCPPFSCTAPAWLLEVQPPQWNCFSVSALYNFLSQVEEQEDDCEY